MDLETYTITFGDATLDILDPQLDYEQPGEDLLSVLTAFIVDTYASCPYYRKRLDRHGIVPDRIQDYDDFRRIPTLSPTDAGAAGGLALLPAVYVDCAREGRLADLPPEARIAKTFHTTSTTGYPKVSYYTIDDWNANCAMFLRQHRDFPVASYCRTLNCYHAGHYAGNTIHDSISRRGCLVENLHFTYTTVREAIGQLETNLQSIGGFNAIAIPPGAPDADRRLRKGITLDELLDADFNNFIATNIRAIFIGGSPNLAELRLKERLAEANELAGAGPTRLIERYGSSEVGVIGFTCPHGSMHVSQGFVYTEILDARTGEPVEDGQRGMVVVTGLHHGSRYVRYFVGDEATYISGLCACGRRSARICDVRRVIDVERLQGGCAAGGF